MNETQALFFAQMVPYVLTNLILFMFGLTRKMIAKSRINNLLGYRTSRSMQSEEAWKEAHLYFGKLAAVVSGLQLSGAYWILKLPFPAALVILIGAILLETALTEIHLARKFPPQKSV